MSNLKWKEEALDELKKVPGFVRVMARRAVESYVKSNGRDEVTLEDLNNRKK